MYNVNGALVFCEKPQNDELSVTRASYRFGPACRYFEAYGFFSYYLFRNLTCWLKEVHV